MFKNMKLGKKLIVGFGIVIILMVVCVGAATLGLSKISNQVNMYVQYTVPNTNSVWQMRRDLVSVQRHLLIGLVESDQAEIQASMNTVEQENARIAETLAVYKGNARVSQEEVEELHSIVESINPYVEQLSKLILMNDPTANAQAFEIYLNEYKPLTDECADLLTTIGEEQDARADDQADTAAEIQLGAFILLLAVFVGAIVATVFVVIGIRKAILVPVIQIENAAKALLEGNLNAQIDYTARDEFGSLAGNMAKLCDLLKIIIKDEDYLLGEMADGNFDLVPEKEAYYVGDFNSLLQSMARINGNLSDALSQINTSAEQVSGGSDQVSSGAQALSQGATEQASSVEELLATLNEVSDKIKANAAESQNANKLSDETNAEVQVGSQHMEEMSKAMADISAASSEIGKIIKTIEDIAFQTNILALNAAVEAARAGDAGKGFAVVADEVRSLASKSGEAAKNTTELIEGALAAVENGSSIVGRTAESLHAIVGKTAEVSTSIEKIAIASNEQAMAIGQITQGVEQISAVVQANSATAEESAAASEELSGQAQILNDLVGKFKLQQHENIR